MEIRSCHVVVQRLNLAALSAKSPTLLQRCNASATDVPARGGMQAPNARKETSMKGLAGIFQAAGEEILVEEVDVPELEEGSILIRNTGGAVCGSDLHGWRGDGDKPMRKNRYVGGHECSGVVDTLTGGITTDSLRRPLKEGDRVVFPFFFPCQRCYHARTERCTLAPSAATRGWAVIPGRTIRTATADLHSTTNCRQTTGFSKRRTKFRKRRSPRQTAP